MAVSTQRRPTRSVAAEPRRAAETRRREASDRRPGRVEEPRRREAAVRSAASWQSVWLAFAVALMVFCVLGSGSLVQTARSMPIGPARSVALPMAGALDRVVNFFSLNRPADAVATLMGRNDEGQSTYVPPAPTTVAAAASTTAKPVPLRQVTPALPLVVASVGDSMAQPIGELLAAAQADGRPYSVSYEYKVSSGLARPDYYNWPARLRSVLSEHKPEAVVMTFGGNDAQALTQPDGSVVAQRGTAAWAAEYQRRVGGLMDAMRSDGRRLIWLLPPRMRSAGMDRTAAVMRQALVAEAAMRPWVLTVDTVAVTSGPNGEYADAVVGPDGQPARCRQSDGVHFTVACSRLVVAAVERVIDTAWHIDATTPATATPPVAGVPTPTTR